MPHDTDAGTVRTGHAKAKRRGLACLVYTVLPKASDKCRKLFRQCGTSKSDHGVAPRAGIRASNRHDGISGMREATGCERPWHTKSHRNGLPKGHLESTTEDGVRCLCAMPGALGTSCSRNPHPQAPRASPR